MNTANTELSGLFKNILFTDPYSTQVHSSINCVCVCVCLCVCLCVHVCMHVCVYACMYVCRGWMGRGEGVGRGGRGGVGGGCKTTLKCWNSGQKGSLQNKIFKV